MPPTDYHPRYGVENYSFVLPFEAAFDTNASTAWIQRSWFDSVWIAAGYIIVIHLLQHWMQNRKPYHLDDALVVWNSTLAAFSIIGLYRMSPEMWWAVHDNSFKYSICTASFVQGVSGFWADMFGLSKVAEMLDTLFIVLRKRPLRFLHWYHHATVLVITWHACKDHAASGRWFMWMNYLVHSLMYTYYALKAMQISVPKRAAIFVTTMQLSQMVIGLLIGGSVFTIKMSGKPCQQTWENLGLAFTIYFTYFILFCHYFHNAYLKPARRTSKSASINSANPKSNGMSNGEKVTINGTIKNRPLEKRRQPQRVA